jgi:hypothetical protein
MISLITLLALAQVAPATSPVLKQSKTVMSAPLHTSGLWPACAVPRPALEEQSPVPFDSSTLALYRANESGDEDPLIDLTGNFTAPPDYGTTAVPGYVNGARSGYFGAWDGSMDPSRWMGTDLTIEAWVQMSWEMGSSNDVVYVGGFQFGFSGNLDYLYVSWPTDSDWNTYAYFYSEWSMPVYEGWHHIAMVYKHVGGGLYEVEFYINGISQTVYSYGNEQEPAFVVADPNEFWVGNYRYSFDDIRVSAVARSPQEIMATYLTATPSPLPPMASLAPGCVLECGVGPTPQGLYTVCSYGYEPPSTQSPVPMNSNAILQSTPWFEYGFVPSMQSGQYGGLYLDTVDADLFASLWEGDHTVIVVGAPSNKDAVSQALFTHGDSGQSGLHMFHQTSSNFQCVYGLGGGNNRTVSVAANLNRRWSVATCRKSGNNYTARVNGASTTVNTTDKALNPAMPMWFGKYYNNNYGMGGPLAKIRIYNYALSNDELARLEFLASGAVAGERNITTTRVSQAWLPPDNAPENVLLYSELLNHPIWAASGNDVPLSDRTPNAAPDTTGNMTLTAINFTGNKLVAQSAVWTVPNSPVTLSCEMSAPSPRTVYLNGGFGSCSFEVGSTPVRYACTKQTHSNSVVQVTMTIQPTVSGVVNVGRCLYAGGSNPGYVKTENQPRHRTKFVEAVGDNVARINQNYGLLSFEGRTSYWTNSLDLSAASWSGCTGTRVTNVASGPFSRFNGGPEVDTFGESDPAASCGLFVGTSLMANGGYTLSCYARKNTTDQLRMRINTNGTGMVDCLHTLTNDFDRYTCSTTISGATAGITPSLWIGGGPSGVGTVDISQCQFEQAASAGPPIVCGASACGTVADNPVVGTAGWPVAQGEIELEYTPMVSAGGNRALFDARVGTTDGYVGYINSGNSLVWQRGGVALSSAVLTWTQGTTYRIRFKWGGGVASAWRDGVLVFGPASITAPTALNATASVGNNLAGTTPANGYIKLLKVSQ